MLRLNALRECKNVSAVWRARVCEYTILASIFVLLFSTASYAQVEGETVDFNIPSSALPQALKKFARQARVELVFAERGFDSVQTRAVVGSFEKERALELLLAGTGLRVGFGSGDSVIVQRADASVSEGVTSFAVGDSNSGTVLLAQAAVDASQGSGDLEGADYQSGQATYESGDARENHVLEEVLVTGSRIRGAQSTSPIITISRQEIDQAGFATVEDIVENLPQNFGSGATVDATNVENFRQVVGGDVRSPAGGTSVNLRGLGSGSTLVLLNGRRMSASGVESRFSSISSIPVSAVERVEVMTDGASAIYGSDAIGGVMNFILRDDYEGAETRLRYGSDSGGDTSNVLFAQSFGNSWEGGNVLFSYEYYNSENLASRDRNFTASNDLSGFGGTDWRQPGGNPANIRTGGFGNRVFYAIPEGQDGTALTPTDFVGLENTQHFYNDRSVSDVMPSQERHSAYLYLTQTIGAVELFAQARFSSEDHERGQNRGLTDLTVLGDDPATPEIEGSPFFVDPTGTGLTSVRVDNYGLDSDFGPVIQIGEIDSSGAVLGARFEFRESWRADLVGNWSKEETNSSLTNPINLSGLSAAANQSDPNLALNPFGDGSNTNPAVIDSLMDPANIDPSAFNNLNSENELWSASLNVDGDAFDIAGGTVKVATGIDFRNETLFRVTSAGTIIDNDRDVLAVYAEVFVPLVGDTNSRTGLQRFEFSIAARYEDYSDFGDTANPKLGLLWAPTKSLNLRGTIGTSFKAPNLLDLDTSRPDARHYYIPDVFGLGNTFLLQEGPNADLQPEEATTWTVGFQWSPGSIDGLSLDMTYFNIDFTDRIDVPTFDIATAAIDPRFASIRIETPTNEQISAIVNDPLYDPNAFIRFGLGPYSAADILDGTLPLGVIIDDRITNLAQSVVTGAELQLSYSFETDLGSFGIGLNGSYLFDFERKLLKTDPLVDEVDTLGRPVDLRARGNVSWSRDRWLVAGYVNYTDGYTDNVSNPGRAVDSWTTVDLTIAYNIGEIDGLMSDTRLSVTTRNLFDEDPPFVNTAGGVGYDATNGNPLGRFLSFQITKDW